MPVSKELFDEHVYVFLPLLIVLIILSSILISYIHFDNTKRDIIDQQQEEIVSAMIDYRNYISYMTSIVRTIEADYIELVANESSSEAVEALFTHNMREYPIIGQMRMLAPDGMETLRVERINNLPYVLFGIGGWKAGPTGIIIRKPHCSASINFCSPF